MMWWIISALLFSAMVIFIVISNRNEEVWSFVASFIVGVAFIVTLLVTTVFTIQNNQYISIFKETKNYIQNVQPKDEIENAALTNKKVELNSELFSAQYCKKTYGLFSLYPDSVLDLSPIE